MSEERDSDGGYENKEKEGRFCHKNLSPTKCACFMLRKEANQVERTYVLPIKPPPPLTTTAIIVSCRSSNSNNNKNCFTDNKTTLTTNNTNSDHNNCRGVAFDFFFSFSSLLSLAYIE